jgi:hypothetical protein
MRPTASADLLYVVDPKTGDAVAGVPLASKPEHVRFVADTDEVWVTEPSSERIEIFTLPARGISSSEARWIPFSDGRTGIVAH